MTQLAGRHVTLGVSGGIAIYKSCILARRLTEAGALVDVVLTRSAAEFVRPVTFEALTKRPVLTSLWDPERALAHIDLARDPDLVILAPATAHLLARAAQGLADDHLTSLLVARTGPVLAAPAMNDRMYAHPQTKKHIETLAQRGWEFVGPEEGPLAESEGEGPGRMSEPETILAAAARVMSAGSPWSGKRVVVTAGPTRERLDTVRVVTNPSSGRMGLALADAAWRRGADVILITGPTPLSAAGGPRCIRVTTTQELGAEVARHLPTADALFMAAAPADYRPAAPQGGKQPRTDGTILVELTPTPDILFSTRSKRKPGALIVGFALETEPGLDRAKAKLRKKELDFIVLNDALEPGAGFDVETNRVTILGKRGEYRAFPIMPKTAVAEAILDFVEGAL